MKEDIELLELYLEGTLDGEAQRLLENRLAHEPDLVRELYELKLLMDGIENAGRREILDSLRTLEVNLPPVVSVSIPVWQNSWLRVAASVSVLAICAYMFWPQPDPQELFDKYFEPYPNVIMPTMRGEVDEDTTLMARGYKAYDREEYKEAIDYFEKLKVKNAGIYLYLSNCYLAIGEADKAISLLENVIADYDEFDAQAEWYLALGHLKRGSIVDAGRTLKGIEEGGGYHTEKVKALRADLKP